VLDCADGPRHACRRFAIHGAVSSPELETITVDQLAALAKQHPSTIRRAIKDKRLAAVHPGNSRSTRILLSEARRYITGNDHKPT
jgi:excisionase family DNA binding protein